MIAEIIKRSRDWDLIIADNVDYIYAKRIFEHVETKEFAIKLAVNYLMKRHGEHLIVIQEGDKKEEIYIHGIDKEESLQ